MKHCRFIAKYYTRVTEEAYGSAGTINQGKDLE